MRNTTVMTVVVMCLALTSPTWGALTDSPDIADLVYDPATGNVQLDAAEAAKVVPEPATMSLLAIGGLGVLLKRRRRRA